MTRGLRNKNPLNIRHSSDLFQGETMGVDRDFKTFASMPYGYRAAFLTLATYNSRGWNNIEKIVTHWAPPNENNTENYIQSVEKGAGISRTEILALNNGFEYILIVAAMSFVESGQTADISQVYAGFNLQSKITLK